MRRFSWLPFVLALALLAPASARAQLLEPRTVSLEAAKRMVAAAEAEARRNSWPVAISIVDAHGGQILFHRLDGTQPASLDIALGKARPAARFKPPTRALEDAVAGGREALLGVEGILPLEGGIPIVVDG